MTAQSDSFNIFKRIRLLSFFGIFLLHGIASKQVYACAQAFRDGEDPLSRLLKSEHEASKVLVGRDKTSLREALTFGGLGHRAFFERMGEFLGNHAGIHFDRPFEKNGTENIGKVLFTTDHMLILLKDKDFWDYFVEEFINSYSIGELGQTTFERMDSEQSFVKDSVTLSKRGVAYTRMVEGSKESGNTVLLMSVIKGMVAYFQGALYERETAIVNSQEHEDVGIRIENRHRINAAVKEMKELQLRADELHPTEDSFVIDTIENLARDFSKARSLFFELAKGRWLTSQIDRMLLVGYLLETKLASIAMPVENRTFGIARQMEALAELELGSIAPLCGLQIIGDATLYPVSRLIISALLSNADSAPIILPYIRKAVQIDQETFASKIRTRTQATINGSIGESAFTDTENREIINKWKELESFSIAKHADNQPLFAYFLMFFEGVNPHLLHLTNEDDTARWKSLKESIEVSFSQKGSIPSPHDSILMEKVVRVYLKRSPSSRSKILKNLQNISDLPIEKISESFFYEMLLLANAMYDDVDVAKSLFPLLSKAVSERGFDFTLRSVAWKILIKNSRLLNSNQIKALVDIEMAADFKVRGEDIHEHFYKYLLTMFTNENPEHKLADLLNVSVEEQLLLTREVLENENNYDSALVHLHGVILSAAMDEAIVLFGAEKAYSLLIDSALRRNKAEKSKGNNDGIIPRMLLDQMGTQDEHLPTWQKLISIPELTELRKKSGAALLEKGLDAGLSPNKIAVLLNIIRESMVPNVDDHLSISQLSKLSKIFVKAKYNDKDSSVLMNLLTGEAKTLLSEKFKTELALILYSNEFSKAKRDKATKALALAAFANEDLLETALHFAPKLDPELAASDKSETPNQKATTSASRPTKAKSASIPTPVMQLMDCLRSPACANLVTILNNSFWLNTENITQALSKYGDSRTPYFAKLMAAVKDNPKAAAKVGEIVDFSTLVEFIAKNKSSSGDSIDGATAVIALLIELDQLQPNQTGQLLNLADTAVKSQDSDSSRSRSALILLCLTYLKHAEFRVDDKQMSKINVILNEYFESKHLVKEAELFLLAEWFFSACGPDKQKCLPLQLLRRTIGPVDWVNTIHHLRTDKTLNALGAGPLRNLLDTSKTMNSVETNPKSREFIAAAMLGLPFVPPQSSIAILRSSENSWVRGLADSEIRFKKENLPGWLDVFATFNFATKEHEALRYDTMIPALLLGDDQSQEIGDLFDYRELAISENTESAMNEYTAILEAFSTAIVAASEFKEGRMPIDLSAFRGHESFHADLVSLCFDCPADQRVRFIEIKASTRKNLDSIKIFQNQLITAGENTRLGITHDIAVVSFSNDPRSFRILRYRGVDVPIEVFRSLKLTEHYDEFQRILPLALLDNFLVPSN